MPKPTVKVTVISPEGKVKTHKAYRAYIGKHRVTWIRMDGVRMYVLLRHGFVVTVTNIVR